MNVHTNLDLTERRVKSKFVCKEASFFVLKSLFFAEKIQKQEILGFYKSLFSLKWKKS